ncbi:MAG TPA: GDP-L-fucose synthase [Rhodospirillales bacterium]|jgi:GDP-L-fucose synthase
MSGRAKAFTLTDRRVFVAGHRGMLGGALVRRLEGSGCRLLTADRKTLDLRRQDAVADWLAAHRPQVIFLTAAHVGGIQKNIDRPAELLYDNLMIEANVIDAAWRAKVEKVCFVSSSCVYPRLAPQPMKEDSLWTGPLEPTNAGYGAAKLIGMELCRQYRRQYGADFITAIPCNLFGPGDEFGPEGHVVASLMRRFHEAKLAGANAVEVWGTGKAQREFLYVDDCADALVFLAENYSDAEPVNVGMGSDVSILELARLVGKVVGFAGEIALSPEKPDGMPRKLVDTGRLEALGWRHRTDLEDGLRTTYRWFVENAAAGGG